MKNLNKPSDYSLDDRFPKDMSFENLYQEMGLNRREVLVTLINPVRKGEYYKQGKLTGFKSGIYGGGWNSKHTSFDSTKMHWIKKPKVHVTYNVFEFFKGQHSDWVDIDNCVFNVVKK